MNAKTGQAPLSRRELLKTAGIAGAAALLGDVPAALAIAPKPAAGRKRVLRLAHLTDIHVQPERKGAEGLAACLHHVQSRPDPPQLILNGGDTIMDCMAEDHARTKLQWELWQRVIQDECSLPVESCIGNHDVWGWNKAKSKTTGDEPRYGKKWAMEMIGVDSPYRSFERAGWRCIVLDSVFPDGDGYQGRLDDAQFAWLENELRRTSKDGNVLLLSHIPILSAAAFFDGDQEETGNWVVPRSYMHIDARRIKDLFYKYPCVKLALSGHLHLTDRVDYLGVTYACSGAVSGGWWRGPNYECEPGYALVNLYSDGTCDHEYVTYGWKAAEG